VPDMILYLVLKRFSWCVSFPIINNLW